MAKIYYSIKLMSTVSDFASILVTKQSKIAVYTAQLMT